MHGMLWFCVVMSFNKPRMQEQSSVNIRKTYPVTNCVRH